MTQSLRYAEITTAAGRLDAAKADIEGQLAQLRAMIQALQEGAFRTDVAAPKFQDSYTQWNTGTGNAIAALTDMAAFLRQVVARYQQTDSDLGSQV